MINPFQTINEHNSEKEWSMTRIQMAIMAALWVKHRFFPANKTVEVSTIATIRDTDMKK